MRHSRNIVIVISFKYLILSISLSIFCLGNKREFNFTIEINDLFERAMYRDIFNVYTIL